MSDGSGKHIIVVLSSGALYTYDQEGKKTDSGMPAEMQFSEMIFNLSSVFQTVPAQETELLELDGTDARVKRYIFGKDPLEYQREVNKMFGLIADRLLLLENKREAPAEYQFGLLSERGKHRSVAVANILGHKLSRFLPDKYRIVIIHYDLGKQHVLYIDDNDVESEEDFDEQVADAKSDFDPDECDDDDDDDLDFSADSKDPMDMGKLEVPDEDSSGQE